MEERREEHAKAHALLDALLSAYRAMVREQGTHLLELSRTPQERFTLSAQLATHFYYEGLSTYSVQAIQAALSLEELRLVVYDLLNGELHARIYHYLVSRLALRERERTRSRSHSPANSLQLTTPDLSKVSSYEWAAYRRTTTRRRNGEPPSRAYWSTRSSLSSYQLPA